MEHEDLLPSLLVPAVGSNPEGDEDSLYLHTLIQYSS
jgi:hypothetical protein